MSDLRRGLPALACVALLAVAAAVVLATYRDYGVTWDEGVQAAYGELVVAYFRSGFQDLRADEFVNLRFYGPLFEAATALACESAQRPCFEVRHLATALFGLLALPALMAFARGLRLPWLPALAALVLVTLPRFWGHLFHNSKDVPFAVAFALATAVLAALLRRPRLPLAWVLAAGSALGLAGALRPGGLPLLALALAGVLAASLRPPDVEAGAAPAGRGGLDVDVRALDASGAGRVQGTARMLGITAKGGLALALAWAILVAPWPSAHGHPFSHPLRSMLEAASFGEVYPVLFEGRWTSSQTLPATYLPKFLAITTPPVVLLLAALGLAWSLREQARAPRGERARLLALAQFWLLVPLAFFVALRPSAYDGLRHFLFVMPAVALFAALGGRALVAAVPRAGLRRASGAALVLALLLPVRDMVRLHPYQASYFNLFVGGLAGAEGRYETDYWKSSYKEALEWIEARAREQERPLRVLVAATESSRTCATAYASPRVQLDFTFRGDVGGALPAPYDYYVATYRWRKKDNYPRSPVVHSVGRDGAVFTVIRGRR